MPDIAKPLELPEISTPLILKIDEKLKEAETSSPKTINILEKDLSQIDKEIQSSNTTKCYITQPPNSISLRP